MRVFEVLGEYYYHGSEKFFKKFKMMSKTLVDTHKPNPVFFSPYVSHAVLNGPIIYKVILETMKTFDGKGVFIQDPQTLGWDEYENLTREGRDIYELLSKEYPDHDHYDLLVDISMCKWDVMERGFMQQYLIDSGYDSFYVTGDGERNIAVIDISRIKVVEVFIANNASGSIVVQQKYPDIPVKEV